MSSCVDRGSAEYRTLKKMTGVDDRVLSVTSMFSMDEKGRMPEIDEVPNADSLPVLEKELDLKYNESSNRFATDTDKFTNGGDMTSATIRINNRFKDMEVRAFDYDGRTILDILKRPNIGAFYGGEFDVDTNQTRSDVRQILDTISDKSRELYGIDIKTFNSGTVDNFPELQGFDYGLKNAFILNGNIYVNTDYASLDAPVHEMMHLLLGELKFNDSKLYNDVVSTMAEIPNFEEIRRSLYNDIPMRDAMEEIFVTQIARRMVGMDNIIDKLPLNVRSKIEYDILRMVDTSFMGANSAIGMKFSDLSSYSVHELCKILGSSILNNKAKINNDLGFSHRIALNLKRELLRNGELKEIC